MLLYVLFFVFGVVMKWADLVNEHQLMYFRFRGDNWFWSIILGTLGAFIMFYDRGLASCFVFALTLSFLPRQRLDCPTHTWAATIIFLGFMQFRPNEITSVYAFLLNFLLFGSIRDVLGRNNQQNLVTKIVESGILYFTLPLWLYSWYVQSWGISIAALCLWVGYNGIKYGCYKLGWYSQL
jgi:hypothetical protein